MVDHEGEVLEAFVTKKRDRKAALNFLKKSMKHFGRPEIIERAMDQFRSPSTLQKFVAIHSSTFRRELILVRVL